MAAARARARAEAGIRMRRMDGSSKKKGRPRKAGLRSNARWCRAGRRDRLRRAAKAIRELRWGPAAARFGCDGEVDVLVTGHRDRVHDLLHGLELDVLVRLDDG